MADEGDGDEEGRGLTRSASGETTIGRSRSPRRAERGGALSSGPHQPGDMTAPWYDAVMAEGLETPSDIEDRGAALQPVAPLGEHQQGEMEEPSAETNPPAPGDSSVAYSR